MTTTVTVRNMVTIPAEVARRLGIRPGWKLQWSEGAAPDLLVVRVIPDRAEMGRRLRGQGKAFSPERDAVAELVAERETEG